LRKKIIKEKPKTKVDQATKQTHAIATTRVGVQRVGDLGKG